MKQGSNYMIVKVEGMNHNEYIVRLTRDISFTQSTT